MIQIGSILHNRVAQNASWLIAGKIAQMVLSLVVGVLTARFLGPSNYGLIGYGAAYTAFFMSLCTLGINSIIVKEFIDHPNDQGEIMGTTLFLRILSSTISFLLIIIISICIDLPDDKTIFWVVILCNLGLVFSVLDTFNYWFQSKLKSKKTAIATFFAYLATSIYRIILLFCNADVYFFALASSVDYIVLGVLLFYYYRKEHGPKLSVSANRGKQLLRSSYHFILPGVMVAIYAQTDKLMLKEMMDIAEVGYYNTAHVIATMWTFILTAIIDSLYPPVMESFNKSEKDFERKNKIMYAIVFYVSIAFSLVITLLSTPLVSILYGNDFLPAVMPLSIIVWYNAFSFLGVARNAWIICMKKQNLLIYIYISAAVINILLNFVLIPKRGSTGAALASLLTQIIVVLVIPFFIPQLKDNTKLILESIVLRLK